MKLAEPITAEERKECLRYMRSDWWSGPKREGEKREGQLAPDSQNPEAFTMRRLMYEVADEYERLAGEKGLL